MEQVTVSLSEVGSCCVFPMSNPIPFVIPAIFGNINGTDLTYFPANTPPFNAPAPFVFNQPNNPSYSNDINMAFNLGGALADISWLEAGDVPIVSFHCENDTVLVGGSHTGLSLVAVEQQSPVVVWTSCTSLQL